MKKYASLLFLALLLNGCDDGDLTVETINFESIQNAVSCPDNNVNTLLYKLKTNESLLLQLPKVNGIVNDPGFYTYTIDNSQYRVVYRAYDGTVGTDNICGAIPPSTPKITEEWIAKNGTINIETIQKTTDPDANGATRIKGYTHNIIFTNITYEKPAGPQVQAESKFGSYDTTVTPADLTFADPEKGEAYLCADGLQIYNYSPSMALTIDNIDQTLLKNEATLPGQPRSSAITSTTNKVSYRNFVKGTGSVTRSYFCNLVQPATPAVNETWIGTDTSTTLKATIEVTTQQSGTLFIHTIVLRNVLLTKDHSSFKLGDIFTVGKITR